MSQAYWIDVEDALGTKQGCGPITSATSWTCTPRLDRVGTFFFTMPATDDRASLLRLKRYVRCWVVDNGILQNIGWGIIDNITAWAGTDGKPTLSVGGDDLMRELTYRTVGELALYDTTTEHPAQLFVSLAGTRDNLDDETPATDLPNSYDLLVGDATTDTELLFETINDYRVLYVKHSAAFDAVVFTLDTSSGTAATVEWQFWNAEDEEWQTLSVTDGTLNPADAAYPFYQSGTISWDIPSGWAPADGEANYKVRCYVSADGVSAHFSDVAVRYIRPTSTVLAPIMSFAPDGWSFDTVNGYGEITAATEFGTSLVLNGSFEAFTGTEDDATTDAVTSWSVAVAGNEIAEVVTDGVSGTYALKLTTPNPPESGTFPSIYQNAAVSASSDYLLTYWAKGDGTVQVACRLWVSLDSGASYECITAREDSGVTAGTWTKVIRRVTMPAAATHVRVRFEGSGAAGACYVDHVSFTKRLGGEVLQEFAGESAMSALVTVVDQTGEHFTRSPNGKEVLWLRGDNPQSGVRALGNADGMTAYDNDKICLITDLTEIHNAYDLVSRVYAFGGGQGSDRVSLADCTRAVPTGYVMDVDEGYLERTAAITALGLIERVKTWSDINAPGAAASHREYASNQLFDRAYNWLQTHSAAELDRTDADYDVPRAYRLSVTKLNRVLLPGYTVRVQYIKMAGSYTVFSLDEDMIVLSSTVTVDPSGIRTVGLEVSTQAERLVTDAEGVAEELKQARYARARTIGSQGLNSGGGGIAYAMGIRDGRVVNVARRAPVANGTYTSVTVRDGVITSGSS